MSVVRNIYNLESRVHPLKMFGPGFYLKRDDELSSAVSGSKLRKYASLIPYLLKNGAKDIAIIGSTQSNNVVGLSSALIEHGMCPHLFLLEHHTRELQGNFALTSLFGCQITWVSRKDWKDVYQIAGEDYQWVIPEGADHPAAVDGSGTLVDDIIRNENDLGITFDRIFLDSGSGSTARSTLKRLSELGVEKEVHVVEMSRETKPINCHVHRSAIAASFGSINRAVIQWVERVARQEGVLVDPIYSAKLFATVDHLHREHPFTGNTLLVHSGLSPSLSFTISRELERRACASNKGRSRSSTAPPS